MSNKKDKEIQCFVIMPISKQAGYEENHFDLVYADIIKPAIDSAGMISIRADEVKNTNLIHLDILRKVIETPIAICDMSAKNPNVFYELGMRQAFDKPTVLIKDANTEAPFDISGLRYVTYDRGMGYREVLRAIDELKAALTDTYNKRDDRSEVNSLVRLLEISSPATLSNSDLSESEKQEEFHKLQFEEIHSAIRNLSKQQNKLLSLVNNRTVADEYMNKVLTTNTFAPYSTQSSTYDLLNKNLEIEKNHSPARGILDQEGLIKLNTEN